MRVSIVVQKTIRDHVLFNGLESKSIVISNELVRFVSGACQNYQDYLAQRKDKGKATQSRSRKVSMTERD